MLQGNDSGPAPTPSSRMGLGAPERPTPEWRPGTFSAMSHLRGWGSGITSTMKPHRQPSLTRCGELPGTEAGQGGRGSLRPKSCPCVASLSPFLSRTRPKKPVNWCFPELREPCEPVTDPMHRSTGGICGWGTPRAALRLRGPYSPQADAPEPVKLQDAHGATPGCGQGRPHTGRREAVRGARGGMAAPSTPSILTVPAVCRQGARASRGVCRGPPRGKHCRSERTDLQLMAGARSHPGTDPAQGTVTQNHTQHHGDSPPRH